MMKQQLQKQRIYRKQYQEFLEKANQAYPTLRNDPEAWQEELAERELWEQTIY